MVELINKYLEEIKNDYFFLNAIEFKYFSKMVSFKFEKKVIQHFKKNELISALDILKFKDITAKDKLWIVLRKELISTHILHEFGCKCAERALSKAENPDPRSLEAIRAKRLWIKGEITRKKLEVARNAAWDVAYATTYDISWNVTRSAAYAALYSARDAAWYSAKSTAYIANDVAKNIEQQCQIEELIRMLKDRKKSR